MSGPHRIEADGVVSAEIFVEVVALDTVVPDIVDPFPAFGSRCGSSPMTAFARRISARRWRNSAGSPLMTRYPMGFTGRVEGAVDRRDQDEAIAE